MGLLTAAVAYRFLIASDLSGGPDSLDNINTSPLPDGSHVFVVSEHRLWVLRKFSTAAASPNTILAPAAWRAREVVCREPGRRSCACPGPRERSEQHRLDFGRHLALAADGRISARDRLDGDLGAHGAGLHPHLQRAPRELLRSPACVDCAVGNGHCFCRHLAQQRPHRCGRRLRPGDAVDVARGCSAHSGRGGRARGHARNRRHASAEVPDDRYRQRYDHREDDAVGSGVLLKEAP